MVTLPSTFDSLSDQLASKIRSLIDRGLLKPGERLPSIRAAAIEYGVAKNTVVEAYERLVASGQVRAQRGSGFYVCSPSHTPPNNRPPHVAEALDLIWLL